ncbi:phage protein NinX family protein [Providencia hangzhouensis]|uniref:phage protein NinX family protein n=1 Tax=Providencia hangzhouensis TaxID=3031799 RepID=UPI0030D1752C
MNKYTKLSDFEINKAVFHKAKIKHKYFRFLPNGVITYNIKGKYQVFDPCNNPSDAMPIVIENNISITLSDDKGEGKWMAFDGDWYDEHSLSRTSVSYGDNYYRIAMICFLLMKDAENE